MTTDIKIITTPNFAVFCEELATLTKSGYVLDKRQPPSDNFGMYFTAVVTKEISGGKPGRPSGTTKEALEAKYA